MPAFPPLKRTLESAWVEQPRACVGLAAREHLLLLWDIDVIFGGQAGDAPCEVNVSSVSPVPLSSIAPLVEAVKAKLGVPA